jgi:hypothetical protein
MMIRVVVATVMLAAFVPASLAADCPSPDRKPQVEIVIDDGKVAYDFTRTRAQMRDVPRELGMTAPNHGRDARGLTFAKLSLAVAAELRYRDVGGGRRCVYPDRIVVTVTSQQRVFVDIRYPEGSCERQAVLDHEEEHVRINRAAAHSRERSLRNAVETFLAAHPYYLVPSGRALQDAYLVPLQDRVKPILNTIHDEANAQHARLDSPSSYAATRARCQHW